jgi:hypothetical protein
MTHFVVLVIGNDVEKQLEPFWELDLSDDEMRKDHRAVFEMKIKKDDVSKEFEKWKKEDPDSQAKLKYKNARNWINKWHGYSQNENGDWGHYHNPNDKWDWYQIGGRWTGYFKLKPGAKGKCGKPGLMTPFETRPDHADQARACDIDWDGMVAEKRKSLEDAVKEAGGNVPGEEQGYDWFTSEKPKTVEEFLDRADNRHYPADILKDGQWYTQGKHGWWGMFEKEIDDKTWRAKVRELIDSLPPETLLTLVDCHI